MKRIRLNITIIGLSIFLIPGIGFSQTDSLYHYLDIASKNNPVVMKNYYEFQAALEKVPQAASLQDPQLQAEIFLTPMELIGGKQVAGFQFMQMFPWFGTLRAAKDEMSLMANASYETFRDSRLQVFYDVQKTWYELYKLKKEIEISERNIEILRTIERLAIIRFKTAPVGNGSASSSAPAMPSSQSSPGGSTSSMQGMGNSASGNNASNQSVQRSGAMQDNTMSNGGSFGLADLYRIQIEIGELVNNMAMLKNQRNVVMARFNSFLNRQMLSPVFVPDSLMIDTVTFNVTTIKDSMLFNNPMLGMLDFEKQSLDARKKMVTRMGYPMVGLGLNYIVVSENDMSASEMNGEDMIMPMVSISLPIYRKKYKAMRNETDIRNASVEQQYIAASNNLRTEYYEALQLYEDSKRRIRLFYDQGILAKSSLNIMMKGFATSTSSLTDILRVRQQVLDYDYRHVEAVADYYTAVAWLKRLGAVQPFFNNNE